MKLPLITIVFHEKQGITLSSDQKQKFVCTSFKPRKYHAAGDIYKIFRKVVQAWEEGTKSNKKSK